MGMPDKEELECSHSQNEPAVSEALFRSFFEQAAIGMFVATESGEFLRVNQRFADIIGAAKEEIVGQPRSKANHPEDLGHETLSFGKFLDGQARTGSWEKRYLRKDGSAVWCKLTVSLMTSEVDQPRQLAGIVEEIPDQRRSEEELQRSLVMLRIAGKTAKLGGWRIDLPTKVLHWSDEVRAICEVAPDFEPTIEKSIEYCPPEYRDQFMRQIAKCAKYGTPFNFERELITATGKRIWVLNTGVALRDEHGAIVAVQGALQDVNERKEAQALILQLNSDLEVRIQQRTLQLQAANRFLDSMIEHIPAAVVILDAESLRYVRVNRAAELISGLSRDDMLGKSPEDVFDKTTSDALMNQYHEVLESGGTQEISEYWLTSRMEGARLMRTAKVAMHDENLKITHILGISEDVTEQREQERKIISLNAALEARAQELNAANKSLESFTSAATHDLRSPLSIIGGYAGILEKKYANQLDETGRRYVSVIGARVKSMSKLIDDLLAFSKLGVQEIKKTSVDVQVLAEKVLADILQLHPKEKKPVAQLGKLPPALADEALLRQVWQNLLSNAVKYSSCVDSPLIEVSGRIEGAETVYSVRDNGAGFDMADYDKLFEIFQRLHTEDEFEGTGVGLPIVHRIVTRHGGRVWAEGKVGQGAVFHFALPI